jgi:hypothetical protein
MTQQPLPLTELLCSVASIWAEQSGTSVARLGRLVVNDTSFFTRFDNPRASTTTATLEKFAAFLGDAGNWTEGAVPQEAVDLAHRVGITTREAHNHAA